MNTIIIIVVVVVLAIGGIAVANWVQAREREEAEKRHRVSGHRGAINEAQDLLEFCTQLPVDQSVKSVLLDYAQLNIQAIKNIDERVNLADMIKWADELRRQTQEQYETERSLKLPSRSEDLTTLRTKIHRLTEFIAKLRHTPSLDAGKVTLAFKSLARVRLRCDIEGHIKLGKIALVGNKNELAKQYYKYAYDRLVKENITDSYVQEQLAVLEEVMKEIRDANEAIESAKAPHQDSQPDPNFDPTFQQKKKW